MGIDSSKSAAANSVHTPTPRHRRSRNLSASSFTSSAHAVVEGVQRRSSNEGSDSSNVTPPKHLQSDEEVQKDSASAALTSYTRASSKLERHKSPPSSPSKKLGLWNNGNTCYTNSVLQVLYENSIFRDYCENEKDLADEDGLLYALAQLFVQISGGKRTRRISHINPSKFIHRLKEKNSIFRSPDHHDAHEFYSYLMNVIGEELLQRNEEPTAAPAASSAASDPAAARPPSTRWRWPKKPPAINSTESPSARPSAAAAASASSQSPPPLPKQPATATNIESLPPPRPTTWLHELCQGYLVYETRCLCCENITRRREPFLDVPLDIEADNVANLTTCIRHFARTELLKGKDKYFCDLCGCLQEAERSLRFERLPPVLAIHLKRFKYDDSRGCYSRVSSKVEFPAVLYFPADALARDHPCNHSNNNRQRSNSITESAYSEKPATNSARSSDGVEKSEMERSTDEAKTIDNLQRLFTKTVEQKDPRPQVKSNSSARQPGPAFDLSGVVVHIGTSMSHGHYISCVRSDDHSWWLYDDHTVQPISSTSLSSFYGSSDKSVGAKCGWPQQLVQKMTCKRSSATTATTTSDTDYDTAVADGRTLLAADGRAPLTADGRAPLTADGRAPLTADGRAAPAAEGRAPPATTVVVGAAAGLVKATDDAR